MSQTRVLTDIYENSLNAIRVDVIESALPLGNATAAKQDTGNTSLSSLDTKAPTQGQKTMVASLPVVLASDQSSIPVSSTLVINSSGSVANNAAVGIVASTFIAPATAIGFILEAESTNTANIRWAVGAVATSTVGHLAEPGRDTGYIPLGANISVIALSGVQAVSVQWILR